MIVTEDVSETSNKNYFDNRAVNRNFVENRYYHSPI